MRIRIFSLTPTTIYPATSQDPEMSGFRSSKLCTLLTFTLLCFSATIYATELAILRRANTASVSFNQLTTSSSATPSYTTTPVATSSPAPTGTNSQDTELLLERTVDNIVASVGSSKDVSAWLSTLQPDGKWPDDEVDYTTGCAARRANWPAQTHWKRILIMGGAWHGGNGNETQFVNNTDLRDAISRTMTYWFSRDLTNLACLDNGGTDKCSCDNPNNELWNTNWFSNIILIPELVGQVCLLLKNTLTNAHKDKCAQMMERSFDFFYHADRPGFLSGANVLDIGKIGIYGGLLTLNTTLLHDAYNNVHGEIVIHNEIKKDGVRTDGTFGQHGILYNGNYGKDFANDILDIELVSANTEFAAGLDAQKVFGTLFDADRWMVIRNTITGVLHWDLSVIGRFISFPVIDAQATGSIKMSLDAIRELGDEWSSAPLKTFAETLSGSSSSANAGNLTGNRMFFTGDYMIHRGPGYVSTLKMYSSRSLNSECLNLQNPFGYHLSDGTLYTYVQGNEYEDIAAVWDWNLIPGITVDYGATPLNCGSVTTTGIEDFVGGVSDGTIGIAAMRYTNPLTKSLSWQKTWFFVDDDVQVVAIANLSSATVAPVLSVLDQRRSSGPVILDGREVPTPQNVQVRSSIWHGGVGYSFSHLGESTKVNVTVGAKSGTWTDIGTSTQPPTTVDIFTASIQHQKLSTPISYMAFPGTTPEGFEAKKRQTSLQMIQNDKDISAVFDEKHNTIYATFWNTAGGTVKFNPLRSASITIKVSGNLVLIYKVETGEVIVADPSQDLNSVDVTLLLGFGLKPASWGQGRSKSFHFVLPSGGVAGSSITKSTS